MATVNLVGVHLGVGLLGVYAGIVLDYVVRSLVVYRRFASGAWKRLDVGSRARPD